MQSPILCSLVTGKIAAKCHVKYTYIHDFFYKQTHFLVSTGVAYFFAKFQYWSCLASFLIFDLTNFKIGSIHLETMKLLIVFALPINLRFLPLQKYF